MVQRISLELDNPRQRVETCFQTVDGPKALARDMVSRVRAYLTSGATSEKLPHAPGMVGTSAGHFLVLGDVLEDPFELSREQSASRAR